MNGYSKDARSVAVVKFIAASRVPVTVDQLAQAFNADRKTIYREAYRLTQCRYLSSMKVRCCDRGCKHEQPAYEVTTLGLSYSEGRLVKGRMLKFLYRVKCEADHTRVKELLRQYDCLYINDLDIADVEDFLIDLRGYAYHSNKSDKPPAWWPSLDIERNKPLVEAAIKGNTVHRCAYEPCSKEFKARPKAKREYCSIRCRSDRHREKRNAT